jgi:hypothetical protein
MLFLPVETVKTGCIGERSSFLFMQLGNEKQQNTSNGNFDVFRMRKSIYLAFPLAEEIFIWKQNKEQQGILCQTRSRKGESTARIVPGHERQ